MPDELPEIPERDILRELCIKQGYVPPDCQLAGQIVWALINSGDDPCGDCTFDRRICHGRASKADIVARARLQRERKLAAEYSGERTPAVAPAAIVPEDGDYYFLGIDSAPAIGRRSDDGALVAGRARMKNKGLVPGSGVSGNSPDPIPQTPDSFSNNPAHWWFEFVWAYVLRGARVREWSGFIHAKHRQFGFMGILMDPGGGGIQIMQELAMSRQLINGIETECTPIVRIEEMTVPGGAFILNMFKRGDPGINELWPLLAGDDNLVDAMHVAMSEAVEHGMVILPRPFHEIPPPEFKLWSQERQWAARNLRALGSQLVNIQVATNDDGTWALTRHHARQFSATGKKDIAYAGIYAYIRFLIWLRSGATATLKPEDASGFSVMR